MKLTNNYNLPEPLVSAIRNDPYDRVGDISISGLIRSPRMRILEKRHDLDISEDASDQIWKLLGQSVHSILERADTTNHLAEERMVASVLGWKVSGKPDLLGPDGILSDYKVTSVYSFLLGEKPEWEMQLNFYRWLYVQHGFKPKRLQIVAILRDWSRSRSKREPYYPQVPILRTDIPMWEIKRTEAEIEKLVTLHQRSELLPDDSLPECTADQRWARPTTYAVKKEGNKKAYRVFEDSNKATALADQNGMVVETRPGENVRCEDYCLVNQWCNQYSKLKGDTHASTEEVQER